MQRVPPGELLQLEPRWKDFIPLQLERCHARHQRLGLPPRLLAAVLFLLHRFSEPRRQIHIEQWEEKAGTLGELERLLWPL